MFHTNSVDILLQFDFEEILRIRNYYPIFLTVILLLVNPKTERHDKNFYYKINYCINRFCYSQNFTHSF